MKGPLLAAYFLMIAWSIGALGWIAKEMAEQRDILTGLDRVRAGPSPEGERAILDAGSDAPLYLVQELQQESRRDAKIRVASVLEKLLGKNPKEIDTGNVLSAFNNEKTTLDALVRGEDAGVETSWLTDSIRARLQQYRETGQAAMTAEEKRGIMGRVEASLEVLWGDLPDREKKAIREAVNQFVSNRWADLGPERMDRLCDFLGSMVHLKYGRAQREDKDRFIELLIRHVRSRGEDVKANEKPWLAEQLGQFLERQLPDSDWKSEVVQIGRAYALDGWAPLIEEEKRILAEARKLRQAYEEQRGRVSQVLLRSVQAIAERGEDVDRVLLTEIVSLLSDTSPQVTEPVEECLLVLARERMKKFARAVGAYPLALEQAQGSGSDHERVRVRAEESLGGIRQPMSDLLTLVRKTLYRESVSGVMAVQTREKSQEERKRELDRLLHGGRIRCAHLLGRIAVEAQQLSTAIEPAVRPLFEQHVTERCREALLGILGSSQADVVEAAQEALKAVESAATGTPPA
ncbi:MAG: hypothetical protein HYU36_23460 [Planctomycetes bacterium]|nr:hypothetical protein [Planctomycetota bacterium]